MEVCDTGRLQSFFANISTEIICAIFFLHLYQFGGGGSCCCWSMSPLRGELNLQYHTTRRKLAFVLAIVCLPTVYNFI